MALNQRSVTLKNVKWDIVLKREQSMYPTAKWVKDDEVTECQRCHDSFSIINRKHHCRVCGYENLNQYHYYRLCVCGDCSQNKVTVVGYDSLQRACSFCVQKREQTSKVKQKLYVEPSFFIPICVLGKGAQGEICLVKSRDKPDEIFAVKTVKNSLTTQREQLILETVFHPFIVKMHYTFLYEDYRFFVMDYLPGGDLFNFMTNFGILKLKEAKFYSGELVLALEYLHSLEIAYRDLKPENIMINTDGHLVLVDFGVSKMNVDLFTGAKGFVGSPEFTPPELIKSLEYGRAVDFWSFGLLLCEMISGVIPFYDSDLRTNYENIVHEDLKLPDDLDKDAADLITNLLQRNPRDRLGVNGYGQLKEHKFYSEIDWIKLSNKEIEPTLNLVIKSPDDYQNFDSKITSSKIESTHLYKFCHSGSNSSFFKNSKAEGYKFTMLDVIEEEY